MDHEHKQEMKVKINKSRIEHFVLDGKKLRRYLTRTENFRKVFVVESEEGEKIDLLSDIPDERTFYGEDMDAEEFIGKIICWI